MEEWSDRKAQLLRALSDPIRYALVVLLHETGQAYLLNELLKELHGRGIKCGKSTGSAKSNLVKHLRELERVGLVRHGQGKHDKWFPLPKKIYTEVLRGVDEIGRLVAVGKNISKIFELHPRIVYERRKEVKEKLTSRFCMHLGFILIPENFGTLSRSPSLTWEIYQKAREAGVDFSTLVGMTPQILEKLENDI